jgi:hypothetical protein
MQTTVDFLNYNAINSFKKVFDFKGSIAPIAEKSTRNFKIKTKNEVNMEQRIHYFALAHAFKQLDTENLFEFILDETSRTKKPTRFVSLQSFDKQFINEIGTTISNIRDLNSHYIHDFEQLKLNASVSPSLVTFLKESFELALIQIYIKEKRISFLEFRGFGNTDKSLVEFLHDKFLPFDNKKKITPGDENQKLTEYLEYRKYFKNLSKDAAIEELLFAEIKNDYEWKLFDTHPVLNITAGKYLSFYACLFLLSMFLYKSEANQLISKIKGFKKNATEEEKSKRELFMFFSKKFNSMDVDCEENKLVKFRDLVLYLNHYPVAWNKDIELESGNPQMTDKLKKKITDLEINRSFPSYEDNHRFAAYAKYTIWGKKHLDKSIEKEYITLSFSQEEIQDFEYEINTCPELKDAHKKLRDLQAAKNLFGKRKEKNARDIEKTQRIIRGLTGKPNPIKLKLIERIERNKLIMSYGRNQDRFIDFAAAFLADINYFGKDARFKMYRFYSTEEQNTELATYQLPRDKKAYDKLKFHKGRLTCFASRSEHLQRYETWDNPFVIENNAIQLKLQLDGAEKTVTLQRALLIYLLEDALKNIKSGIVEATGHRLLQDYYRHNRAEFDGYKSVLMQEDTIKPEQKTAFNKLLPKRLLHHYSPAITNNVLPFSSLAMILEKARLAENRYESLASKAKTEGNYDDFIKRNKGKQFKLQFIRKAWHLMYFKNTYLQNVATSGHHKHFHIERDEFNDFSRYMFAFDEVPQYKYYLNEMFENKGFFENKEFKQLFQSGTSLDNLYTKTKQAYKTWHTEKENTPNQPDKYSLASYEPLFSNQLFFINLSHFINYLKANGKLATDQKGLLAFDALTNVQYLIADYYYTDKLEKPEYKSCGKLYNQLKSTKLEDALLYEMAMSYLNTDGQIVDKAKYHITELLKHDVQFDITDKKGIHLYHLLVPFKQIDSFVGLQKHKEEQDNRFKNSFLANIAGYLEMVKDNKDIRSIHQSFNRIPGKKILTYDELNKIDAHLVSKSMKFTNLALNMEQYFIFKESITIKNLNRIKFSDIPDLGHYVSSSDRDKAFHFGIPNAKSYDQLISEVETKFIASEVRPQQPEKYYDLNKQQKNICSILLETIHNDYFEKKGDGIKKRESAEQKYFEFIISKQASLCFSKK